MPVWTAGRAAGSPFQLNAEIRYPMEIIRYPLINAGNCVCVCVCVPVSVCLCVCGFTLTPNLLFNFISIYKHFMNI